MRKIFKKKKKKKKKEDNTILYSNQIKQLNIQIDNENNER